MRCDAPDSEVGRRVIKIEDKGNEQEWDTGFVLEKSGEISRGLSGIRTSLPGIFPELPHEEQAYEG